MDKFEPGIMLPVDFVRAVDGDTIEVEVRRTFHVRLRDIDVVEKHDKGGKEATELASLACGFADNLLVFIPTNNPHKLMDITSFERIVGDVYVNQTNLADVLRDKGFEKKG